MDSLAVGVWTVHSEISSFEFEMQDSSNFNFPLPVLVITGSRSAGFDTAEWRAARDLLKAGGTVVVLMGLARLEAISKSLTENGCDPSTPAAIVSRATWPDEQARFGTIANIHEEKAGLSSPAILVLGNVIAFGRDKGT